MKDEKPFAMLRGADVPAAYVTSPLATFKGNPLIEALPPLIPLEEIYQWTQNVAAVDEQMINTMYEYSQGITDVAVKLFMVAQWRAIATGDEIITPELIEDVAKNELRALFPVIQAFRVNDMERQEEAMDVFHKEFEIENHFNSILTEIAKKLKKKQGVVSAPHNNQAQLAIEAVRWLVEAGFVGETAEYSTFARYHRMSAQTIQRTLVEWFSTDLLGEL